MALSLLGIWFKHRDLLPSFDTFIRQRRPSMAAFQCRKCGALFKSVDDWRSKTDLVEEFQLIAGGRTWERRVHKCGAIRRFPTREGESHAESRNP